MAPRRISDDLAWLRGAFDEPVEHDLHVVKDSAALAWEVGRGGSSSTERLARLDQRGVLNAAGFLLHEDWVSAS